MSAIFNSLGRIWKKDEPPPISGADCQNVTRPKTAGSTVSVRGGNLLRRSLEPYEITSPGVSDTAITFDFHRHQLLTPTVSQNPCTTSTSSSSCCDPGHLKSSLSKQHISSENLEVLLLGHSLSRSKLKSKHIMWEDSGYASPIQKNDLNGGQITIAAEKDRATPESNEDSNPHSYDDTHKRRTGDVNYNLSRSRSAFGGLCNGEKFCSPPPTQRNYIPPSLFNYRYQPRRPKSSDQERSMSALNDSMAGMSPLCTSTPIKSTLKLGESERGGLSNDGDGSLPVELFDLGPHSQRNSGSSKETYLTPSTSALAKEMIDESVAKIVEEGSDEFRAKYSHWISQVFYIQLDRMQRRVTAQFNKNLETAIREKEREIISLHQKYRNKLIEFETSTEKFQSWIQSLAEENLRVRETKDAIIAEMEKTANDQKDCFRLELEKQINNVQAECEKEKLALQRQHADQLKRVNDKSMEQVTRLEGHFGRQVDALQTLIRDLKSQNAATEEQLAFFKKSSNDQHSVLHNKYVNYRDERERLMDTINDLREKLSISENEKAAVVASHNDELFKIRKENEEVNQTMSAKILNYQASVEGFHQKSEDEAKRLKRQLISQESQHTRAMNDLRNTYGHKISELTKTVEQLQKELMGGRQEF